MTTQNLASTSHRLPNVLSEPFHSRRSGLHTGHDDRRRSRHWASPYNITWLPRGTRYWPVCLTRLRNAGGAVWRQGKHLPGHLGACESRPPLPYRGIAGTCVGAFLSRHGAPGRSSRRRTPREYLRHPELRDGVGASFPHTRSSPFQRALCVLANGPTLRKRYQTPTRQ